MGHSHTHTRGHAGHSHSHDNTLLLSKNKNDAGVRITKIGLYSNLAMALAKGAGGVAFGSQAMVADAWHSATDLASDILTLATVSWSLRPPTALFPAGFGKVESLGSLGVSGMLLIGGAYMCVNSVEIIYAHAMLDAHSAAEFIEGAHGHSHSHGGHGHGDIVPSLHAAWLAAGTVVIKEWLYQATMKVAKERKSSVLASNAVHHRVDSLTGIVTLFAILGANMFSNMAWLDSVGGLLISLLVIKAGWGNTMSALYELADKSIDEEIAASIRNAFPTTLSIADVGQLELKDITGVKSGQNYLVDLEVAVREDLTVQKLNAVEEEIRESVGKKVRGLRRLKVRFVPKGNEGTFLDEFIDGDLVASGEIGHDSHEGHEHGHVHIHEHGNGEAKKSK